MKPANAIFLVLLAVCALLGAGMVSLWMGLGQGIRPAPALIAATPAAAAGGESEEFQLPAYESYAEVIQRPLFNDDRRPRVIDDEVDVDKPPEDLVPTAELNVAVTGIIITPTTQLAMVRNNVSKESLRLKVGMALDGEQANWTLTDIEPRRLVFNGGTQGTAEVKLETFTQALKGGAPPPPRRNVVTQNKKKEDESGETTTPAAADTDSDRAARAEEIRRRVAERRAQLREEAERRRAEANLDEDDE
ncbi:MAG: hypothetical protein AB8B96_07035 [Lysobacterales bacterium]